MDKIISRLSVYHLKKAYKIQMREILGHLEAVKRLDRAYEILVRDDRYEIICTSHKPLTFEIKGPNDSYTVIDSQRLCTCPDGEVLCKHRLCVKLILRAIGLQKEDHFRVEMDDI